MSKNKDKTNVMRFLDQNKIDYTPYKYETDGSLTGKDVANLLNKEMSSVFKTLVTVGKSNQNYVFVIPVDRELDLKKAAEIAKEKSIRMIPSKELLGLTGYIHGGCSPLCMKKQFPTFIDYELNNHQSITFSAGKIGYQVEITLENLRKVLKFDVGSLTE